MRRSRLAAARAGHVRKRGQPHGRQRNVGSPRGPHLMVSTSMVYGCTIDVFNTEDISAECPRRSALRSCYDYVLGLCGRMKDVAGRAFRPLRCFVALPRKARHFGDGWGTGLDCGFKWLERYGCEREIVIGVILFHKLIETKRHVDWNVQNLALFAEILVA